MRMKDLTIKGTGNSRFLKSIANFKAQYPTYDDFVNALVAGTLPVDLAGLNSGGVAQAGTPLNKNTLLTDTVAENIANIAMSSAPETPNDALDLLALSTVFADFGARAFEEIATSRDWTAHANILNNEVTVICVGGGGGGGSSGSSDYYGGLGGGGGGGYVAIKKITVTPGAVYPITIGAGGACAPITTRGDGTAGGTTSFGSLVQARGGSGGGRMAGGDGGSGGGAAMSVLSEGTGGTGHQFGGGGGGFAYYSNQKAGKGGDGGPYGGGGGGGNSNSGTAYFGDGGTGGTFGGNGGSSGEAGNGTVFAKPTTMFEPYVRLSPMFPNGGGVRGGGGGYGGSGGADGGGGGLCSRGENGGGGLGGNGGKATTSNGYRSGGGGGGFFADGGGGENGKSGTGYGAGGAGYGGDGYQGVCILIYQTTDRGVIEL